jgi:hypothetical protein
MTVMSFKNEKVPADDYFDKIQFTDQNLISKISNEVRIEYDKVDKCKIKVFDSQMTLPFSLEAVKTKSGNKLEAKCCLMFTTDDDGSGSDDFKNFVCSTQGYRCVKPIKEIAKSLYWYCKVKKGDISKATVNSAETDLDSDESKAIKSSVEGVEKDEVGIKDVVDTKFMKKYPDGLIYLLFDMPLKFKS